MAYYQPLYIISHYIVNELNTMSFILSQILLILLCRFSQESVFPDGVVVREFPDGTREVL